MISKLSTLFLFSLFSLQVFAQAPAAAADKAPPEALVTKINGEVLYNGVQLKLNDKIDKNGTIETKEKSFVQLKIEKWKNMITIGPTSKMAVNFQDEKKYMFEDGSCRWKSYEEHKDPNAQKGKIFTKYASMGVRGTDFTIKSNALLGETELYMFDGEVEFANLADVKDKKRIQKNQWVGIGGRFGTKVSSVIQIPKQLLEELEKDLK